MKTWFILREPGCVPVRKGPWQPRSVKTALIEFMNARPRALITVLTIHDDGEPSVQDAPEALQMLDGRQRGRARRHIASSNAAWRAR